MFFLSAGCKRTASADTVFTRIRDEMRAGQMDLALQDVNAAQKQHGARDPLWQARFRVQKAQILMLRGSYSEALGLVAVPLPPALLRSDTEVRRLMIMALTLDYLQRFKDAEKNIGEAQRLATEMHSPILGDVAQSLGIIEIDQKKYAEADQAFRLALRAAQERGEPSAELRALANLGNVAMWQEHYDEAVDRFKAALSRAQKVRAPDVEAKTLGNLGWNYSSVGDFDNAESAFKDAQAKSQQAGLVGDATYWLNSLAAVYFQKHRFAEADELSRKAYAMAKTQDDKGTQTQCLNNMSEIALATGRLDDAEKSNDQARRIENEGQDSSGITYSTLIAGRIAAGRGNYRAAVPLFQKVLAVPDTQAAHRWEAHARLAQVYVSVQKPAQAEAEFKLAIQSVGEARDSIQSNEFRVSFLSSAITFYDAYVNFLIDERRPLDALKAADLSRLQYLNRDSPPATASLRRFTLPELRPQETARRLNATLLFYWLGETRSWLWAVTPSRIELFPLPAGSAIEALVQSYRDSFPLPDDPLEKGNPDGAKLFATLVQPAAALLPSNSRVIILPDRQLNTLNFESLIVSGPNPHYWLEDVTVLTANSLALVSHASLSPPAKPASLLLIADPVSASPDFPALPQAAREIGVLENYFAPAQRTEFTRERAVPGAYIGSAPGNFSFVHFTAHGTASRATPLESAVILSPEGDSFKLYARDIVRSPISAYLVTISACNGAGVKTYAGAGLIGLAWAFLSAGAHNVIAGLWEVSAASTPQLMDELYKNLNAGQDPASALRHAKLSLLHSAGNYRRPFYWAPFVLYVGS